MSLTEKRKIMEENSKVKSIIEWCNDQHEKNGEVKILWDGGNDSGWAHLEVDGDAVDDEYAQALVDRIHNTLDYGSWAGDFNATGEAVYDPTTSTFVGVDYYSENESDIMDSNITVTIPKSLWFNSIDIECDASYDDTPTVSVRFIVKNGFLTEEHSLFSSGLEDVLETELGDIFGSYSGGGRAADFSSCTDEWILDRTDGIEDGDNLLFYIKQINITVMEEQENPIVLELDEETAAAIDKQLNANNETED